MNENIKKIANDLIPDFESFIVNQLINDKTDGNFDEESPLFSINTFNKSLDVWKKNENEYELVKMELPSKNDTSFVKRYNKEELKKELEKFLSKILE